MSFLRLIFFVGGLSFVLGVTCLPAAAVSPWQAHELAKAATDQAWSQVEQIGTQLLEQPQPPRVEAQLRYNLGLSLFHQDRFEEALPHFEELSQADIDRELKARSNYNLGNTHFRLEQFDEAMGAYQQALLLNPDDDDARYNIEVLLRRQEDPENQDQDQDQDQDSGESEDDDQHNDDENESEESDEGEQEQEDSTDPDEGDSEEQQGDPSEGGEGGENTEESSSQNQSTQPSEEERQAAEEELERARLLEYFRQQERDGRPPMVSAPQPLPPGGKAW